jgi:hypothetical protein
MRLSASLSLALVGLAALTAPALQASDLTFGAHAGLALPTGDLKTEFDSAARATVGLHMNVDFGGGQVLRPRLELTGFSRAETTTTVIGSAMQDTRARLTTFGADYLYYLEGQASKGLYGLAGAGLCASRLTSETHITSILGNGDTTNTFSSTKPYFCFGAGYQFSRHWGTEVRVNLAKHESAETSTSPKVSGNVNTITAVATFRF